MDVEPIDPVDAAVTVALLATFLGVCFVALVPTVGGAIMGLAGLLGWHIHPDAIAQLLS